MMAGLQDSAVVVQSLLKPGVHRDLRNNEDHTALSAVRQLLDAPDYELRQDNSQQLRAAMFLHAGPLYYEALTLGQNPFKASLFSLFSNGYMPLQYAGLCVTLAADEGLLPDSTM